MRSWIRPVVFGCSAVGFVLAAIGAMSGISSILSINQQVLTINAHPDIASTYLFIGIAFVLLLVVAVLDRIDSWLNWY